MARQNIQFKGLRHSPSDITGQDGDLLECVNLIHENGELKPIEMPERMMMRGYGKDENVYILVAVHNLTDGKKFVFARFDGTNTNIIVKRDGHTAVFYEHAIMGEEIQWAETIGNTLIIGTDKSTHYALYKNEQYRWLGDQLPQPVFEFDLETGGNGVEYDSNPYLKDFKGNTMEGGGIPFYYTDSPEGIVDDQINNSIENRRLFAENIKTKIANLINKNKKEAKFIFPFFVRYAVKMYDGNYVMHSAPVLMLPSTDLNPLLLAVSYIDYYTVPGYDSNLNTSDVLFAYNPAIRYLNKKLKYKFKGFYLGDVNVTSSISDWEDVIKSVDLFLSSQIITFNEDYLSNTDNIDLLILKDSTAFHPNPHYISYTTFDGGRCYAGSQSIAIKDKLIVQSGITPEWQAVDFMETETITISGVLQSFDRTIRKSRYYPLPSYSTGEIRDKIENTNLFYKVKRYELNELKSTFTKYLDNEVDYGLIERLETLPTLPDDYLSQSRISGSVSNNYNQRLLLGNIKVELPMWYLTTNYHDGMTNTNEASIYLCFVIEKRERTIYIKRGLIASNYNLTMFGHFIYFPDPDCTKVIVSLWTGDKYEIPMKQHDGLHGSFALSPRLKSLWESRTIYPAYNGDIPETSTDRYYQMQNTIAMSSVANPFHFPATNFKDIGRTKVVGIAANTLDVGFAQWGPFPIAVFCSDGIINVTIDKEGKFGGIDAVSADVLREPRGLSQPTLIQLGQALMFLTQRGVMTMAGTQIKCISEVMDGRHFNPMRELADVDYHIGAFANLIGRTSDDTDFRDFAASGFLAYDYAHHRVLLLRSDRDYQYVYSLNTSFWSKQIIYTNLDSFQVEVVPGNELPAQRSSGVPLLKVKPIRAAVNNYTEMYLQDEDGWLYKTMEVQGQNSVKQLYQYGYIVSRPIRFGTDEYKTIVNALHRYNHYAKKSFVRFAMYGSRDGVKYGRINTLRGMSYQYFIFVVYTYLKPNERYSYLTIEYEKRLTNKPR